MTSPSPHTSVKLGFERQCARLQIADIELRRVITPRVKRSAKYRQILSSVREVGIVEPPQVVPTPAGPLKFLLVAGHLRIEALKDLGKSDVVCLVATDDEAFTSNKYVSRLATVQEIKMMRKAIERGVAPERIASALDVDVDTLRIKLKLLDCICSEAVALLRDRQIPAATFSILQKMAPLRQIEVAEFMILMNDYTSRWAKRLLTATVQEQLAEPHKPKKVRRLNASEIHAIERETGNLDQQLRVVEQSYGSDHLELMIARTYLGNLLSNARVVRYLAQHHAELLQEFQKLVDMDAKVA